jgi:hypothetical protein
VDGWHDVFPKHYYGTDTCVDGSTFLSGPKILYGLSVPADARNEAVTKALNKIADQKVNLGENLATFGQTLSLFVTKGDLLLTAMKRIQQDKSLKKFWRLSWRDLSRNGLLTTAAQEYLAYVYGLRPLMQDVYQISEELKHHAGKDLLLKAVGSAQRSKQKVDAAYNLTSSRITPLGLLSQSRTKCTLWARIDPNHRGMRALNQFGLSNPFGLAWDLVPFSFCVDWFLPVGPVLYALTAPWGLLFVDGSISFRNTETNQFRYEMSRSGNWIYSMAYNRPADVTVNYEGYSRTRLSNWPLPGLWFSQNPLSDDRPLKALALGIVGLSGARSPIR